MGDPTQHHAINYIEFFSTDIERTKQFYSRAFGWSFQDWGPDYVSFDMASAGVDGGFRKGDGTERPGAGAPLVVLYSDNLEASQEAVTSAGGEIVAPIFDFPGGRRFHFSDGVGNVLAVWGK